MFKSHYLLKFLSAAIILVCVHAYGIDLGKVKGKSGKVKGNGREVKFGREVKVERLKVKGNSNELKRKRGILKEVYTDELGVREFSSRNDGPDVEKYLRYVRLKKGQPWCAAFVCWALGETGIKNPRSGWSPDLFPASKVIWQRTRAIAAGDIAAPRQGDVFGVWYSDKGRIAHVGFVDKWDGKWIISVEGNTNGAGSAEGDGVYRKRRLIASLYKVADFIQDKRI